MPEIRRGVLVTRPAADAAATADRVRARGFEPVVAPVLDVITLPIDCPPRIDAVLVTSGNALASVSALASRPLLAVGDGTAAKARASGFTSVESAGGDAASLAALVCVRLPAGSHLLLSTTVGEGDGLVQGLASAGYIVHRRFGYAIQPVPRLPDSARDALVSGRLHAALFLSARTALVFRDLLPRVLHGHLLAVEALAIGAPAAAELAPLPWSRVRVSLAPTLEQVLALL